MRKTLQERFEEKVAPVPIAGCWLWTACLNTSGYGRITVDQERGCVECHRLAYEMYVGPIPAGFCVLHRCDVRCCVNPAHLFLGSVDDNNKDRAMKGRSAIGERHARSRFTREQILAIRADARGPQAIALENGVRRSVISNIKARRSWAWLT